MNSQDKKFVEYLEKLKCEGNKSVMESIIDGFKAIVEYQVNGAPETKLTDIMMEDEEPEEVVIVISDETTEDCPMCQIDDPGIVNAMDNDPPVQQPLFNDEDPNNVWIDARFSVAQLRDMGFSDGEIEAMSAANTAHPLDEGAGAAVAGIAKTIASNPAVREALKEGGKAAALAIIEKLKQSLNAPNEPVLEGMDSADVKSRVFGKNSDQARHASWLKTNGHAKGANPESLQSAMNKLKMAIELWNRQQESYGKPENVIGRESIELINPVNESDISQLISIAESLMEVGESAMRTNQSSTSDNTLLDKIKQSNNEFAKVVHKFREMVKRPGTEDLYIRAYNERARGWFVDALARHGLTIKDVPPQMRPQLTIQESYQIDRFNALINSFDLTYHQQNDIE